MMFFLDDTQGAVMQEKCYTWCKFIQISNFIKKKGH